MLRRIIHRVARASQVLEVSKMPRWVLVTTVTIGFGLIMLIVGSMTQRFGAEAATLFTLGKLFLALPMVAGVVAMFSFVCRM